MMNPSHRHPRRPHPGAPPDPDGILLADKPSGMTSHDVVDRLRRHFGFHKVGHGGTLDPMATGLLVMLIGRGTKVSAQMMSSDKTYEGEICLGVTTSTEDVDGQVLETRDPSAVTREQLVAEMTKLTGDLMQTPPMVSAVKKQGVPLYKLARKGQEVEREPRLIHVFEFTLLDFQSPRGRFRLRCTKGTYVRTLCADIGRALGCGAHLSALRRTQAGLYVVADATPLDTLMTFSRDDVWERLLPLPSRAPMD